MANQRAIASHLVLSVSRIQQLQYAGVIKKDASLDSARLAYLRWLRERSTSKLNSDVSDERCRLIHHQANLAAIEEETRRSKLIPTDDIAKEWEEIVSTIKNKMLTLPKAASNICLGVTNYQEMEHILKTLVHDALDHLSNTNR